MNSIGNGDGKLCAFTSANLAYLPKVLVLAESIARYAPHVDFYVMLCDAIPTWLDCEKVHIKGFITPHDLDIENVEGWAFKHRVVELCTAVKPFAAEYLFEKIGAERVLYFDPDIALFSGLEELDGHFKSSSVLLTPHICVPEVTTDGILDTEISCLKHGIYNLGFVGIKNNESGLQFMRFWRDRCRDFCFDDIPNGIFTDQRWVDFAPAMFPRVEILRDPQYNVASWNFADRKVSGEPEVQVFVGAKPICFYHFSGFDGGAHKYIREKYCPENLSLLALENWYDARCEFFAKTHCRKGVSPFAVYDNGLPVLDFHRLLYRKNPDLREAFPNPFSTAGDSYLGWLKIKEPTLEEVFTRSVVPPLNVKEVFWEDWYREKYPDVAQAVGRGDFPSCFVHYQVHGFREHRWPNPFFDPIWYVASSKDAQNWLKDNPASSPLDHYAHRGCYQRLSPCPGFDDAWYSRAYPDVSSAILRGAFTTGYVHYLRHGWKEGRRPAEVFPEGAACLAQLPSQHVGMLAPPGVL